MRYNPTDPGPAVAIPLPAPLTHGLPVDAALIHNHYALNDTRALELLPLAKQKGIGIINASPLAMPSVAVSA